MQRPSRSTYQQPNPSRTTRLSLAALGLGLFLSGPALAQDGTIDPARAVRNANPFRAASLAQNTAPTKGGTPPAPKPAASPKPAATTSPTPATSALPTPDELPLPGEKEFAECKKLPPGTKVNISLKPESELTDLVGFIKSISCRPFILPANIRQGKVTVIAPEKVTAEEAYRIFLSSLDSMGLTIQPDGRVLKIIESNRARESSIPVYGPGEGVPRTDQYVTRMLRLRYITTEEVVQVLTRLKGRDGDIMPYVTSNTLIITDLATNIRRMEEVVKALDVPLSGEKIWVIRLKNIVATEIKQMLDQVFNVGKTTPSAGVPRRAPLNVTSPGEPGPPPSQVGSGEDSISQIFPDDRTNSLIIVAAERTYQRVLALVKRLEAQGEKGGGAGDRIHVYGLENANAEDLGQVLSPLGISVTGGGGGARGGRRSSPQSSSQGGQGGGSSIFQEEVRVSVDKSTNSLVIMANSKDYLTVRDLIRRLDIPRRQVYIEAMVMEVNVSKTRDLGLSYHGGYPVDIAGQQSWILGGLQSGKLSSLNPLSMLTLPGLVGSLIGPQVPGTGIFSQGGSAGSSLLPPQFGLVIQALQTNNDVNIMQVPNILTTDNEKATISVGQNLPFPGAITGGLPQMGQSGVANFTALQSVQRQDVVLKLEITPHVNASDYVRLEIKNEISDVADPNYNNLGPATNKRTLETTAVVRDQQPVVLGGIMRDRVAESVSKIPVLGDIPILGYLFKQRRKEIQKQMLLIVLTPYVINDPADLQRIFERKTRERREFIETYAAFSDERDTVSPIDYARKRGALEEINRTAVEAERELVELRAAEQALQRDVVDSGPVELPPRSPSAITTPAPSLPPPPSLPAPSAGQVVTPPAPTTPPAQPPIK